MGKKQGGVCCAVVDCKNTALKSPGVHFYRFPISKYKKIRRQSWINAVKRENPDGTSWVPTASSRICSKHFVGNAKSEHPLSPSYNPTIFPEIYGKSRDCTKIAIGRYERSLKKRQNSINVQEQGHCSTKRPCSSGEVHEQPRIKKFSQVDSSVLETEISPHRLSTNSRETQVDFREKSDNVDGDLQLLICNRYIYPVTSNVEIQTKIHFSSPRKNCNVEKTPIYFDNVRSPHIKLEDKQCSPETADSNSARLFKCRFGFWGISPIRTDQEMNEFAGVTLHTFRLLFKVLCNSNPTQLQTEDNLLIFLAKMKTGLPFTTLSLLFGMHKTTISKKFYSTLRTLARSCKHFVTWPTREVVRATMPKAFKDLYKDCRIIIGCTEIQVDRPTSIEQCTKFYSQYKKGFTVKVLIGCTPNGLVSFVSRCYGGRLTDAQITNCCGFLDLLESGDMVLAKKGFLEMKASLHNNDRGIVAMPPFSTVPSFIKEEIAETYKIASIRINIERIMQRLRIYKILNKFTLEMVPHCDDILFMCGVLVNFQPPITK